MNYTDFLNYKEQHCKFKLKGGKEVYGVIWEERINETREYYFASSFAHSVYRKADELSREKVASCKVSLDDVIKAEPLSN